MSNYSVTFRIADKTVNGKTYNERRELLTEAVRAEKLGYWEETTSFVLAESNQDTLSFAKRACRGLSQSDDMVVVFDPSDMSAAYFGPLKHADVLRSFFPKLQKVP